MTRPSFAPDAERALRPRRDWDVTYWLTPKGENYVLTWGKGENNHGTVTYHRRMVTNYIEQGLWIEVSQAPCGSCNTTMFDASDYLCDDCRR